MMARQQLRCTIAAVSWRSASERRVHAFVCRHDDELHLSTVATTASSGPGTVADLGPSRQEVRCVVFQRLRSSIDALVR
jgi:hypothetical protein